MTLGKALGIEPGICAFVGGGGKTTLIERLADELSPYGRVLIATTARILPPRRPTLIDPDDNALRRAFALHPVVAVGRAFGPKLGPPEALGRLCRLADYALIEADGARGLPLKAPASHEPVIPSGCRMVVAVAGVDGIGLPISTVHRPELYAALLGKRPDEIIAPEDAARVLCHPEGQRKGVACAWRAVLNKADDGESRAVARRCARRIKGDALITSLAGESIFIEHWRDGVCLS
jgi:probable selenium-dependent hydroxylase accessory protein YqeC